jgi:SAM-dependent methyltransferase
LRLPAGSAVLEVGCGAGFLTVALAGRGYRIDAIDSSEAMVDSTRARIADAGFAAAATARVEDVHSLSARDGSYAAVVALGVVPWLHSPERAVRELERVLCPGGAVILTVDNRARLNFVLDPRFNPALVYPMKRRMKALLQRLGKRPLGVLPDVHYPAQLDRLVRTAGLEKRRSRSIGFGPFTFLGVRLLSDARSVALHRRLQRLADRGIRFLRAAGMNYMVLATKPVTSISADGGD